MKEKMGMSEAKILEEAARILGRYMVAADNLMEKEPESAPNYQRMRDRFRQGQEVVEEAKQIVLNT